MDVRKNNECPSLNLYGELLNISKLPVSSWRSQREFFHDGRRFFVSYCDGAHAAVCGGLTPPFRFLFPLLFFIKLRVCSPSIYLH